MYKLLGSALLFLISVSIIIGCVYPADEAPAPNLTMQVAITVADESGTITDTRSFESRSYVLGLIDGLYVQATGQALSIPDTGNTGRSCSQALTALTMSGPVTDSTRGLVVGRSSQAVVIADHDLITPITHGTGANQMTYALGSYTAPASGASSRSFTLSRVMTNGSGSSIAVEECGIYATLGAGYIHCMARDLTGTINVGAGSTITIQYTLSISL